MFKVALMSAGLFVAGVYVTLAGFLGLMFHMFPVQVADSSQSLQAPQNIDMAGWVLQAPATRLNVGVNVQ